MPCCPAALADTGVPTNPRPPAPPMIPSSVRVSTLLPPPDHHMVGRFEPTGDDDKTRAEASRGPLSVGTGRESLVLSHYPVGVLVTGQPRLLVSVTLVATWFCRKTVDVANTRGPHADSHTHDQETHRTGYVYSIRDASRPLPPISIRAGGLGEKQTLPCVWTQRQPKLWTRVWKQVQSATKGGKCCGGGWDDGKKRW